MNLKEVLAISGQSGLFKFVAQSKNGVIVESLTDGKRSNASGSAKVSALGEIAIYTETDDLPLAQVFENIYKHTAGKEAISPKASPEELKKFFAAVLPEYDREKSSGLVQPADRHRHDRFQDRRRKRRKRKRSIIHP